MNDGTPASIEAEPTEALSLEDLEQKRNGANAEAELHRRKRDELNDKTKEWVQRRDALNAQVRQLVEEATKHRLERDRLNVDVRKAKEERDRWNKAVAELTEQLSNLRRKKMPKGVIPMEKLRREIRAMEFKQQTSVLSVDKEREIIDQIAKLQAEIRRREKEMEADLEMSTTLKGLRESREKAETFHKQVSEMAESAQAEHDSMVKLYEQGDALRREADKAQEEFIRTKMVADDEHRRHIDFIRQVHDFDKIIHGIRSKRHGYMGSMVRGRREEISGKAEAELIFEKFKKGEKLSTEDLMALQKSGYL